MYIESLSLISLMVSVDVKHHVYLLCIEIESYQFTSDRARHFTNRCDICKVIVMGQTHCRLYYFQSCSSKHPAPSPV